MGKYSCPCCGYYKLPEKPPGTYYICKVCFWEDDNVQFYDPDFTGGANKCSLNEARDNYKKFGVSELKYLHLARIARTPLDEEIKH